MSRTRISKDQYYLNIAATVLERSTCLRRGYGVVIVKDDEIIATGYNGSPRGAQNCCDTGVCKREEMNIPSGERYELCVAIHAEDNAITSAGRNRCQGATLYIVGKDFKTGEYITPMPCKMCRRKIINAGIKNVIGMVGIGKPQATTEIKQATKRIIDIDLYDKIYDD